MNTLFLSLMEPRPRISILQPVSISSCLAVIPRGPSSRPTKLNYKQRQMSAVFSTADWQQRFTYSILSFIIYYLTHTHGSTHNDKKNNKKTTHATTATTTAAAPAMLRLL